MVNDNAKPHHNQKGKAPRKRLGGGPFVDQETLTQLAVWHERGPSYGELIDRLVVHAKSTNFNPKAPATVK